MLRYQLTHPQILRALGSAGHGAQVLIADSNYPFSTAAAAHAERVYLNLAPGLVTVPDVLRVLTTAIPIEAAHAVVPDDGSEPAIFAQYREIMPGMDIQTLGRFPFYDAARSNNTALVIATGEQRTYACILLTIGVVEAS
jgi:L-fucose mutarotase